MLKKGISVLLIMVLILTTFTIIPFSVSADTFPNVSGFPDFDMDCYVADLFINPDTAQYNHIIFEMNSKSTNKVMRDRIESNTPMMAAMTAWQVATFQASDTSHDAVTQLGYYESIILSSLNTAMKSTPVKDTFDNAYVKGGKMLFDAFKNILKSEYAITNIDLSNYNSLSAVEQTAYMKSFEKAFKQQHPGTSDIGKFTKIFGTIVKTGKAAEECINLFSSYYHCSLVDDYLCEVINDMYEQCPDSNVTMKTALMNISKACNADLDNIALDVVYRGFDIIYGAVVDNTINGIIGSQPAGLAFMIAQSIGKNVSNFLFSTDAICENYYKICCFDEFEKLVRSVTQYEIDKYKEERTNYNANVLFSAVGLMFEINEISCDISIDYAETIYEKSVAGVFLDKTECDNFKMTVNNIRQYKQDNYFNLMTNYIFYLEEDYPEIYASYMKIMDEIENPIIHVTGINFSKKHMTIGLEDDAWFFWNNAEVTPSNATNRTVSYSSSDDSIVSIKPGNTLMIELHQTGTVTITATSEDGGFTDTMTIEVVEGHGTDGIHLEDPVTNIKDSGKCGDDVYWNLYNNGTLKIYGNGKMYNYSYQYPSPWNNYTNSILQLIISDGITSIGTHAFEFCEKIPKINIPKSVERIGDHSFADCSNISDITFNEGLQFVGNQSFYYCKSITNIVLPTSIRVIGGDAFCNCNSLKSITLPNEITSIQAGAFMWCENLTSIVIPESITAIKDSTFENCTKLQSIKLPQNLTNIGADAFRGCKSLSQISIPDGVKSIGKGAFVATNLNSIILPRDLELLGSEAFYKVSSLSQIYISDNVKSIGTGAFYGTEFYNNQTNWQNGILYIENYLIKADNSITDIIIKDGIQLIADGAFLQCKNLNSIIIPDSVKFVGKDSFNGTALYNNKENWDNNVLYIGNYLVGIKGSIYGHYNIKEGTTSVADDVFYSCSSLESIYIPESIVYLGRTPFYFCTKLSDINVAPNNEKYTSINGNLFNKEKTQLIKYASAKMNDSYKIPSSVVCLSEKAFTCCKNLKTIRINNISTIPFEAFAFSDSLTSINIGKGVQMINEEAFYQCHNLSVITLSKSINRIEQEAFRYTGILDIYFEGTEQDFDKIEIERFNEPLENVHMHYDYTDSEHDESLHDEISDILVIIDVDAYLSVNVIDSCDIVEKLLFEKGLTTRIVYDIQLFQNGESVQPENDVIVKIPCVNEEEKVYRLETNNNTLTDMNAKYENGYLVFNTDRFSVYIVAEEKPHLLGDVDGDDNISIVDATFIQRHIASIPIPFVLDEVIADTDEDGTVSIMDATYIQRWLANLKANDSIGSPIP